MNQPRFGFGDAETSGADALIGLAIDEDLGTLGDITSAAIIPSGALGSVQLVARARGVLAGLPVVERLVARFELEEHWHALLGDGDCLAPGAVIARVDGPMRSLLSLERPALNFLQRLSGIATLTEQFVAAVADTGSLIMDTRKTTPGWRALEKYAVRCGGGVNHRFGLFDAVLIKDNHLAWLQSARGLEASQAIAASIHAVRTHAPQGTIIEIEVNTLEQLDCALRCDPDIILVDNFGQTSLAEAVRRRDALAPAVKLEASGGVNLESASALARTGVDRISIGALTHSAPALDVAIDYELSPARAGMDVRTVIHDHFSH